MKQEYFDGQAYFRNLAEKNKIVLRDEYKIGTCSGPSGVEQVLGSFRKTANFVLIDDTTNGNVNANRAGGAFNSRTFTVFIIKHYKSDDMQDYESKLSEVRMLYLQFLSRILRDAQSLALKDVYLKTDNIYYREPGPFAFNGAAGVYFMLTIDEPTDLIYEDEQWTD